MRAAAPIGVLGAGGGVRVVSRRSCDDAVKTESMSAQAADLIETNFVEFLR